MLPVEWKGRVLMETAESTARESKAEPGESRVAWTARAVEAACLLATLVVVYVLTR
ncbi:hypothetical protein [Planobispora takensis]|uniref:Uncharacterized protein n=1 Tax=Planobispora takensis TaxID=1367882 RepID=A0A8J3T7U1_9ACTN|nr:hypothetical protein [Planobispora takensis]GII05880.1 hypothetical protein Pta02_78880 [Planobispora takensis]